MRIELIINTSERGELERLREQVQRLRDAGHQVWPRVTFEHGDASRMAREAAEAGAELLIAAGGDGTVNEAANGLHAHLAAGGGRAPRLGIIPLGTGNDLAAALEIPEEVEDAVDAALGARGTEVDLAQVNGQCFLNVSTGGFGAEATEEAPAEAKRALGSLAYVVTGARKFVSLETSRARFVADDVVYDGAFLLFAVGNSRRTGGGNWLTPRAEMADGLLDLCVVREMSRMEFFKLLPELRTGHHLDHPAVIYRQLPRVVVEAEEELSVNSDGEPLEACRRFEYGISPHRIVMAAP